MQYYNNYVVIQRLKRQENPICGAVNLPFGTECKAVYHGNEKAIVCDKGILCYVSSQTAFDFFAQNDDGHGIERGKLTKSIIQTLARLDNNGEKKKVVWDKIWNDSICLKYKRSEYEDYWLWNYDFYNANLHDLQYIAKLVGAK